VLIGEQREVFSGKVGCCSTDSNQVKSRRLKKSASLLQLLGICLMGRTTTDGNAVLLFFQLSSIVFENRKNLFFPENSHFSSSRFK
jgi:hypothetical protein